MAEKVAIIPAPHKADEESADELVPWGVIVHGSKIKAGTEAMPPLTPSINLCISFNFGAQVA